MNRRVFLSTCATAASSLGLTHSAPASAQGEKKGPFADAPLKMSLPWESTEGETID